MKNKVGLIVLSLFVLALTSCFSYEDIDLKDVSSPKMQNVSMKGMTLEFDAIVSNPNPYNIKITSSDLGLFVGKNKVGKATLTNNVVLKRKKEQSYHIVMNITFDNILGGIMGMMSGGGSIVVKGTATAKAAGVLKKTFPVEFDNLAPDMLGM